MHSTFLPPSLLAIKNPDGSMWFINLSLVQTVKMYNDGKILFSVLYDHPIVIAPPASLTIRDWLLQHSRLLVCPNESKENIDREMLECKPLTNIEEYS